MNPYSALELAVIERLQPLTIDAGRYLKAVDPYNGEFAGERGEDDIKRALLGRQPAILVSCGASRTSRRTLDGKTHETDCDLLLFIVSQHLASLAAQRLGDAYADADLTADPGINQIRRDALELLLKGKLLTGAPYATKRTKHEDDTPIQAGGSAFTVWRSRYSVAITVREQPAAGTTIEIVEGRHNIDNGEPVNPVVITETTANG